MCVCVCVCVCAIFSNINHDILFYGEKMSRKDRQVKERERGLCDAARDTRSLTSDAAKRRGGQTFFHWQLRQMFQLTTVMSQLFLPDEADRKFLVQKRNA